MQRHGKTLAGPPARPCRGHQRGHYQARTSQGSNVVPKQLLAQPAGQAPAWRRVASTQTQQAPAWCHADLCEDPATARAQKPASQRGTTCLISLDARRSEARRRQLGRASLPSPTKQGGRIGNALNAFYAMMSGIDLYTVDTFHLMCASVAAPFDYKSRPMAYWRGIRLF